MEAEQAWAYARLGDISSVSWLVIAVVVDDQPAVRHVSLI